MSGTPKRALFGTDGIRGVANRHPMTSEMALQIGRAVGYSLRTRLGRDPRVLIGKDTRVSGYMIETALVSGLCSVGADVFLVGPLPTPGVAFMTSGMRADAGLMISASHNPFADNGIKVFGPDGFKLPDEEEANLERLFDSDELARVRPVGDQVGRAKRVKDAHGRYAVFAKMAFPRDHNLVGLKIVVDCANGAGYRVAPEVLTDLGAEVVAIGVSPNGLNINEECGALHPGHLAERVWRERAHVGIALDGDADRCILVDERGQTVDGDQVLAILGRAMVARGTLADSTIVATVMSNIGLERALAEVGGRVVRVDVGDRYVVERMRREGLVLGGEQSGHVILLEYSTTGDGLVTGLAVLGEMVRSGQTLSELAACMTRFPQTLVNVPVHQRQDYAQLPEVAAAIHAVEARFGGEGRVLVRSSGTQALVRVMVEGPDASRTEIAAEEIAASIRRVVGS